MDQSLYNCVFIGFISNFWLKINKPGVPVRIYWCVFSKKIGGDGYIFRTQDCENVYTTLICNLYTNAYKHYVIHMKKLMRNVHTTGHTIP